MTASQDATERLAQLVWSALDSADLEAYADLLDPNVRWGPPDDPSWGCHNRDQVLSWYRQGREAGVRARVFETVPTADRILVGLKVTNVQPSADSGGETGRWQVLTVRDGRVVEIVGFDNRADAAARAGLDPAASD